MARNNRSLQNQLIEHMNSFKAFGESRHAGKADGSAKNKIYSYQTFDNYADVNNAFIKFCKENHGVRHLEQIDKSMAMDFINKRSETRESAWSQQLDKSAINKIFDFQLTQNDCRIDDRRIYEVKRGRIDSAAHSKAIKRNDMQNQITIAKATGCRRSSITKITKNDFKLDDKGALRVHLVEKGGRERYALVLKEHVPKVLDILENSDKSNNEALFDKYDKNINNHGFRAEYCANLYHQVLEQHAECTETYKNLNVAAIEEVSQNLGHNRIEVINNYLYKM